MNRLGSSIHLVKALPAAYERPLLIKQLLTANLAFFGIYHLSCGSQKLRMRRTVCLEPESGITSLATFHFCHTNIVPLLFNCGVLATLGSSHLVHMGASHFASVYFGSCAAGAVFAAWDMRSNPNQTQAGGMAGSAGLIAYHAMRNKHWFRAGFTPMMALGGMLLYGMVYDDKAALGGTSAGFAAFLLAL